METFNPDVQKVDIDTVSRWRWMIHEHELRASVEHEPFGMPDNRSAKRLARSRSVMSFDKLPAMTKEKFLIIASHFPGRRVFAVGSRINGDFIDEGSPEKIHKMRSDLLKKVTNSSDYDVTFEFKKGETIDVFKKIIPDFADVVMNMPTGDRKILIPMWDFTKLPKAEFNNVIELVESKKWGALMDIHNRFGLSETFFCCDSKPAERWFVWAIENNIIQRTDMINEKG